MGTTTAGLISGGIAPPAPATGETETWNGSAWTEVADLNTARGEQADLVEREVPQQD